MVKSLKTSKNKREIIRVDFSFKREVFFVVIGAIAGAVAMVIPKTLFEVQMGLPYYLTWIVFGHIAGVYSSVSTSIIAGAMLHIITAISIGVVTGILLYRSDILNISKPSNGVIYGLITGIVVFAVFFIPVNQFVLSPEIIDILPEVQPSTTEAEAADTIRENQSSIMIGSIVMHLVFGVTLGIISSLLEIKFGAKYRCPKCEISFSRIDSLQKHLDLVHGPTPIQRKRILILGGGFAGIEVLRRLQSAFEDDVEIDITLVSRDNFFLFTPMLPEVSSGMIETRHIVTPIRAFCKRARFYEANVESIDLDKKQIIITKAIGDPIDPVYLKRHVLNYDYLVIALGGETNFFAMKDLEGNAFTLKTLEDAMILRNHVISMLEQADIEDEGNDEDNKHLRISLMTFVVVGGGFGGVEAVGELNTLVRDSVKAFYHNIDVDKDVRIILVNAHGRILPEVSEDLSEFALQKLRESGVEVILNKRLASYTNGQAKLNDGTLIPTFTLIWAGGVSPSKLIEGLSCEHDKRGRIIVNDYLQVDKYDGVFALGDCASITDPHTKKPYPPTAQHAIREGRVAAKNLISVIKNSREMREAKEENRRSGMKIFDYKTKGTMAEIGKRTGVGDILGLKVYGFVAWWIWRTYYLATLPTVEKKIRVMIDWTIDLFFKRDVTKLKTFVAEEKRWKQEEEEEQDLSRVKRITEASSK
jgi:NADH:ubiquinone reductase (H+-translocating)